LTRKLVSSYFAFLIILGLPLNLYWNRSYDQCWTVGEWLISYAGGFVRRGLLGELLYQISTLFHIPVVGLIWVWSVAAYVGLILIFRSLCSPSVILPFLLSPLILLAPIVQNFLIRKDVFLVFCYGICLLLIKSYAASRINLIQTFLGINVVAIIAILSHEQFGIWATPSLLLLTAFVINQNKLSLFRAFSLSFALYAPCLIAMAAVLLHKGNADQASAIHTTWMAIPNLLPASQRFPEPAGAIDAIGWTIDQGWRASGVSVFTNFDGWIWVPGALGSSRYLLVFLPLSMRHHRRKPGFANLLPSLNSYSFCQFL